MANFTAGTSFTDGVTNDVTAAKLNALIADAVPTSNLSLNSTTGTISNFTASTANITLGTIPTLTAGTTTSTAATITSATITTGTIPTLVSTTLVTTGTGTAAAPAIVPTGDTNTGLFFPAADTIAFSEGGTESMRIDSSGNVGIGTGSSALGSKLNITGNSASGQAAILYASSSNPVQLALENGYGARQGLVFSNTGSASYTSFGIISENSALTIKSAAYNIGTTTDLNTSWTERLRIDSSGNLLVGTTSANFSGTGRGLLELNGSTDSFLALKHGNTSGLYLYTASGEGRIAQFANSPLTFFTNNTERLRIDSGGNLLVGKTAASNTVQGVTILQDGSMSFIVKDSGGASQAIFINREDSTGTAVLFRQANNSVGSISVTASATAFNTSSDYRLKTNLEPISDGISRLKQLPVYRFNWLADIGGNKVDGFVAHEAQAVVPECVTGEKDAVDADGKPIHQGIDQSKIVPLLAAALKEAIAKIETLESKVAALEAA